jgi:hypothetical protein
MTNDLLCPMQMRLNDIEIQECPKFLLDRPNDTSHALRTTQDGEELLIPLALGGVVSHFYTRKPTTADAEGLNSLRKSRNGIRAQQPSRTRRMLLSMPTDGYTTQGTEGTAGE